MNTYFDAHCNDSGLKTCKQAAKKLGISVRKLDYLREDHRIPFVRIDRRIFYAPADLEQFIEARKVH